MTIVGPVLAAVSVAAFILALRRASTVAKKLELIMPARGRVVRWGTVPELQLRHSGIQIAPERILALKVAGSCLAALAAAILTLVVPVGPVAMALAAYGGFIAPSLVIERRAASRHAAAERAVAVLVERTEALVGAGRPPETALAALIRRPTGAAILDSALGRTTEAYALGAPLFRTLASTAGDDGLATLAALAEDLERARDLGTSAIGIIRERRASLRAAERAKCIEAAAQVEGKLMLILVLCYLPALVLLVIIPLFLGLLEGLLA